MDEYQFQALVYIKMKHGSIILEKLREEFVSQRKRGVNPVDYLISKEYVGIETPKNKWCYVTSKGDQLLNRINGILSLIQN